MGLRPPEAFLQLLLGLLHELERLRAMTVVVVGGLLELLLRALEIARGGVDVGMPAGAGGPLALRRRGRRRGRRGVRGDRGGDGDGGPGPTGGPGISAHWRSPL